MVDRDVKLIQRSVYNTFMLVGDLGGFSGFLASLSAIILGLVNYQNPENSLASRLYSSATPGDDQILDSRNQFSLKQYFQASCLFKYCCLKVFGCLRLSHRDKNFEMARIKLQDEMDLVKLLQSLRFFKSAINVLLTQAKAD